MLVFLLFSIIMAKPAAVSSFGTRRSSRDDVSLLGRRRRSYSGLLLSLRHGGEDDGAKQEKKKKKDRPLLREFGKSIEERVRQSKEGYNRFGREGHYTSAETLPVLEMVSSVDANRRPPGSSNNTDLRQLSSRAEIHAAYAATSESDSSSGCHRGTHNFGRSSGSGCTIVRLTGEDARSVHGLSGFADDFFDGVDDETANRGIIDAGVFRIANNVHAGFDANVNGRERMQVLYSKLLIPPEAESGDDEDPLLLPLEIGELVGTKSLRDGHRGMRTLFDISKKLASAVLGMDEKATEKLLDDGTRASPIKTTHEETTASDAMMEAGNADDLTENISNSYQRLIRYLQPKNNADGSNEEEESASSAFWPHVDSTLFTLIPMPEIPGLEVWAPSLRHSDSSDLSKRGEWVRPIRPPPTKRVEDVSAGGGEDDDDDDDDEAYVVALAGEFLQLLSDGRVPTCIHRVMPSTGTAASPSSSSLGFFSGKHNKPRISAPLFLRPRRTEEAVLDVETDFVARREEEEGDGVYFQEGLLEECDQMRVWDYMDTMSPEN